MSKLATMCSNTEGGNRIVSVQAISNFSRPLGGPTGAKNVTTELSPESYVDSSLLSMKTEKGRAVIEKSRLLTPGKSLSETFTGSRARFNVDISARLTL